MRRLSNAKVDASGENLASGRRRNSIEFPSSRVWNSSTRGYLATDPPTGRTDHPPHSPFSLIDALDERQ